ncbi:hypothetical protein [Candidatus Nitrospira allomarina]|uniref:Uncharacterized protein n=1 Tax=Candidatus Nitrospira allomarina TaxID=3020900 RepID=A0AA96JRY7_9BACT|nr:hypothetical protein [Candidatus Nitrospira allomarina]WNM57643.1 hypothetical protein PP769_16985 [Candidatus Nitrospira allomarina]
MQGKTFNGAFTHFLTNTPTRQDPRQLVMLSPWRSICAKIDDSTAQQDPFFHLALTFAEWVRMTTLMGYRDVRYDQNGDINNDFLSETLRVGAKVGDEKECEFF